MNQTVNKVEAAKRQLSTAIELYFQNKDIIPVYTLGHAAREIYEALCKKAGVKTFRQEIKERNSHLSDEELHRLIIGCRDFFKHANRENENEVTLPDDEVAAVLFLATSDCMYLTNKLSIEAQVFQAWYWAVFPEKVKADVSEDFWNPIKTLFPNMKNKQRELQKKLGAKRLTEARKNKSVMSNPLTD